MRTFFNRLIIFSFMVLVGFCLAKGIANQSFLTTSLASISLIAGIYFLYLLAKAKQEMEKEEVS
jgi:hypothetical protein